MNVYAQKLAEQACQRPELLNRVRDGGGILAELLIDYFKSKKIDRRTEMYITYGEIRAIVQVKNPDGVFYGIGEEKGNFLDNKKFIFDCKNPCRDMEKISSLRKKGCTNGFKGLRRISASAVFSWVFPDHFAVIDKYSIRAFNKICNKELFKAAPSTEDWYEFNEIVRCACRILNGPEIEVFKNAGITSVCPIDLDVWLFNYGREKID